VQRTGGLWGLREDAGAIAAGVNPGSAFFRPERQSPAPTRSGYSITGSARTGMLNGIGDPKGSRRSANGGRKNGLHSRGVMMPPSPVLLTALVFGVSMHVVVGALAMCAEPEQRRLF
jgi:hypothetical protein